MPELSPTDLLVKAASCYQMAWYLRAESHLAETLMRRGDQAMAEYERRTKPPPVVAVKAPPRPSLLDRLFAMRLGPDVLP